MASLINDNRDKDIMPYDAGRYFITEDEWRKILNFKKNTRFNCTLDINYLHNLYPEIAESWLRSRDSNIRLQSVQFEQPFLNTAMLEKIMEENQLLINSAQPIFNAYKNSTSSRYTLSLIETNGVLIYRQGTIPGDPILTPAVGTIWNEDIVGTNAYSISKMLDCPIQLPGVLHYSQIFDNSIGTVAPIKDENHKVIASLVFVQPMALPFREKGLKSLKARTLSLMSSIIAGIESNLRLEKSTQALKFSRETFSITLDFIEQGIITVDPAGKIVEINKEAGRILKQPSERIRGNNISKYFFNPERILNYVNKGAEADINDILLIDNKDQPYSINIRPIDSTKKVKLAVLKLNKSAGLIKPGTSHYDTKADYYFESLIGHSPNFVSAIEKSKRYAKSTENVLLIGESGTGKELFAQAIHNEHSPQGSFIAINCAAMPASLIESELFGYEPGSFTGAERRGRPGKIELAEGGTLFLDEIGDMPYELQAVLLRVLEDKKVMRIGSSGYKKIDFRLIAATNQNIRELVKAKSFREDLFFRLSVLSIELPPLRQRNNDVETLARYFLQDYCRKIGRPALQISPEALYILKTCEWPGNVRELHNVIIYAVNNEETDIIRPESLPAYLVSDLLSDNAIEGTATKEHEFKEKNEFSLKNIEITAIQAALTRTSQNIPLAAELLEIGRSTLYRKLKEYNIKV